MTGKTRLLTSLVMATALIGTTLAGRAPAVQATHEAAGADTLVIEYSSDVSHLDPALCYDWCVQYVHAMYNTLVTYNFKKNDYSLVPDAAVHMPKISNHGNTYTFQIRHNIHFWNGRLVTSADWVYSITRLIDPKTQCPASTFWMNIAGAKDFAAGKATRISGLKALGPFGLRITLASPDASFLYVLAMTFGSVVDRRQVEKYGKSYDALHPMGTGPYMLQKHVLGQEIVLMRNPHYFAPKHAAHIPRVLGQFTVTAEAAYQRVLRGQADLTNMGIPGPDFDSISQDPAWKNQITTFQWVATYFISLNTQVPPFTNTEVRQAVNMAINKPLVARLANGAIPSNTFLPPTIPGHGNYNLYPYDPAKAKDLLAKAGFPNGFSTTFYTDNVDPDPRVGQAIVSQLSAVGIKADLQVIDPNSLFGLASAKGKTPMVWSVWYMDFPDPNDFYEPILSCASAVPGTYNWPWYCNSKVDDLAHRLKAMTNRKKRLSLYPSLDKLMMKDAPIVPMYVPVGRDIHSKALRNYYYTTAFNWNFADYTKV